MERSSGTSHVVVGFALLGLGVLTLPSIGVALLTAGLAHLTLYPVRHRREVYRPVMYGLIAFWVGFVLIGPLVCTQIDIMDAKGTSSEAWCRTAAGIRYPVENPSYLPGLFAGIAAAILAAVGSLTVQRGRADGNATT